MTHPAKIHISTLLYPTEKVERIRDALTAIITPVDVKVESLPLEMPFEIFRIQAEYDVIESLAPLYSQLRSQRTLQTARKILKKLIDGNTIKFYLHKQAAVVGQIHFCDSEGESPLGPITVTVSTEDPIWFVDWLTPHTENGHIVHEIPPFLKPHRGNWLR